MKVIVVGAGIAGMYGALFMAKRGHHVTLIEASGELGGLLRGVSSDNGLEFDCGTHFLRDTGIPEIDEQLFTCLDEQWQRLPFLKVGTYANGAFYDESPFIDARNLPPEIYSQGLAEMVQLPPANNHARTCVEYLRERFGVIFTEQLLREPIEKMLDTPMEELAPQAAILFDLVRILALTPEATREIKKSDWFDQRFAFHFSSEGQSGLNNYYPATGSIGKWVSFFETRLLAADVQIRRRESISRFQLVGDQITLAEFSSGEELSLDHLIWTAPVPLLEKLAGLESGIEGGVRLKHSILLDLAFDKPFQTDVYYAVCYDSRFKTFRAFFYPNANAGPSVTGMYHTCVEVLVNPGQTDGIFPDLIAEELRSMGFVAEEAELIFHRTRVEAAGFPVLTPEFIERSVERGDFVNRNVGNVTLAGKASGKTFFMNETLVEVHRALKNFVGESPE